MRTPAQLARILGWPEARRQPRDPDSFDVPPPVPCTCDPRTTVIRTLDPRWPHDHGCAFAPPARTPKLRIRHDRYSRTCRWDWTLTGTAGEVVAQGTAPSQPAALALGLAALDTAGVRSER